MNWVKLIAMNNNKIVFKASVAILFGVVTHTYLWIDYVIVQCTYTYLHLFSMKFQVLLVLSDYVNTRQLLPKILKFKKIVQGYFEI